MKFAESASEDSKNYLRLKDKDSVRGVFRGDLFEFKTHWAGKKSDICTGALCTHCATSKPKFRFRVNFLVNENGSHVPKIFEQSWTVYCMLRDIHKEYDLEKTVVKITRSGSGRDDTSYSILPVPNGTLSDVAIESLAKVPLLDLKPKEDHTTDTVDEGNEYGSNNGSSANTGTSNQGLRPKDPSFESATRRVGTASEALRKLETNGSAAGKSGTKKISDLNPPKDLWEPNEEIPF